MQSQRNEEERDGNEGHQQGKSSKVKDWGNN